MFKLFNEEVKPSFTDTNINILQVENFTEIFFDVYELTINGNKYIAEKRSVFKDHPVVTAPIIYEDKEYEGIFIIQKNSDQNVFVNLDTLRYVRDAIDEYGIPILESREAIEVELQKARAAAHEYEEKVKRQKLLEASIELEEKKKAINHVIKHARNDLDESFNKKIITLLEEVDDIVDKKYHTTEKKILEQFEIITEQNRKDVVAVRDKLANSLKTLTENYINTRFTTEVSKAKSVLSGRYDKLESKVADRIISLRKALQEEIENNTASSKKVIEELNRFVASENVELKNRIDKGVSKALNRVSNIKNAVSIIEEKLDSKIKLVEEGVRKYYDERIKNIQSDVADIDEKRKKYFIDLIKESKDELLQQISESKDTAVQVINEKYDPKKGDKDFSAKISKLKKSVGEEINNRVTLEVQSLKRLISQSSGGGSVAKQFANGGTMDGDLTVIGTLQAGALTVDNLSASNVITSALTATGGKIAGDFEITGSLTAIDVESTTIQTATLTSTNTYSNTLSTVSVDTNSVQTATLTSTNTYSNTLSTVSLTADTINGAQWLGSTIPIEYGGTGANTAAGARVALEVSSTPVEDYLVGTGIYTISSVDRAISIDASLGHSQKLTLLEHVSSVNFPTNLEDGETMNIIGTQGIPTPYTVTFNLAWKFYGSGTASDIGGLSAGEGFQIWICRNGTEYRCGITTEA